MGERSDTFWADDPEAGWRALYESAPDAMLTVDSRGLVVAANRTAREVLDGEGDLVGSPFARRIDPSDAAVVERLAARGWRGADERRFTLRDGRRVTLRARPVPDTRDGFHHITVRDVTRYEVLEGAEEQRRRMEVLATLAGSIARELNDPMSVVQGRLELLLELGGGSPGNVERHLTVALAHARRVSAMLQNLRLVGRAPATHLERVYLLDAWEAAREIIGPRLADLIVEVDVVPEHLAVGGNEALYARVLANLVERLADYCGRDARVVVRAREGIDGVGLQVLGGPRSAAPTDLVPSSAADEGRLDDGGLGTSIARTLVNGLGGTLTVRSAGKRAMFDLRLPTSPSMRAKSRPVDGQVLVVGDDVLCKGLEEALLREGFGVIADADSEAAIERLAAGIEVEGVVASLLLPSQSGLSLLEEIHRVYPALRGRLVLVTDAPKAALPQIMHVLAPPIRIDELLPALGRRLRARR